MFGKKRKTPRRQLTDQNSKRVYSYYSNTRLRKDDAPDRSRQNTTVDRRLPSFQWLRQLPTIIATTIILISIGYILTINTNPKIVQVSGGQNLFLQDINTYQQAANKIINKSILNYNKVTFNVNGVSSELKQKFPELSDVSISLPLINRRPVIYLSSSQPAMVMVTEDSSMIINDQGLAVVPVNQVSKLTNYNLPTIFDKSGLNLQAGKQALPGNSVEFIVNVVEQFKLAKQPIERVTLPAVANELDIKLRGQNYYLKMDLQGDSREETGAFLAAQAKFKKLDANPSEYVDVRVVGRVYYK
ncbi:MAG: hypothetical protein ACXWLH_06095 [Candidatus Saccharimonadales bacterium]